MPETVVTPTRRYVFTPTKADHEALLKRRDDRPLSLSLLLAAAIVVGLAFGAVNPGWFGELALLPVIAIAAAALYVGALVWRRLRRARRLSRWTPPAEPTEIEDRPDRLVVRENGATRSFSWNELAAVSFDGKRVFVSRSRDDVLVVPRAAFASGEAMRAFALACEERMAERAQEETPGVEPATKLPAVSPAVLPEISPEDAARAGVYVTLTQGDAREVEAALRPSGLGAPVRLSSAALILGLAGGVIAGLPVYAAAGGSADARLFAGALAAWLGAIVLTFVGARRIENARAAEWPADDPRRMPRRIEVDGAGLVSRGADFETRIAWAGVEAIRETEQHVLFITRWKEIYAVPKRCFTDAGAAHGFADAAQTFLAASRRTAS